MLEDGGLTPATVFTGATQTRFQSILCEYVTSGSGEHGGSLLIPINGQFLNMGYEFLAQSKASYACELKKP